MESFAQIVNDVIVPLDKTVSLYLNSLSSPLSDFIWLLFSNKAVWIVLYLPVLFFMYRRLGLRKTIFAVLSIVLAIVVCDQTCNIVKNSVCRLRPIHDEWMLANGLNIVYEVGGEGYSFFSAHAANSFAFAVSSLLIFKTDSKYKYRYYSVLIILWAFLVGISRVFIGKHFAGDVLVGILFGTVVGYAFAALYRKLVSRFLTVVES